MKKVLFVATVDVHIKTFHLPYLKWFKEQGYEVHVATNGKEAMECCDQKHTIPFERSPFKVNNIRAYKELKKVIEIEKYDLIHCHTPMGGVITRLAAKKARMNGTKVIYTAHGFHFYKGAPLLNWLVYYPIEKWLSKYTDCLIAINQEDYQLANKKFKAKKIELVHGIGVDEKKFAIQMTEQQKLQLRREFNLQEKDFVLICIGELNKNKNQMLLLEAMKKISMSLGHVQLLLVGIGPLKKYYERFVKKNKLGEKVHFLGYRKDIAKLLSISDCVISVSKREGLPVNLIEAMIMEKVIIATNCRGNVDLIENQVNGYIIELNDKENLILHIMKLLKNRSAYERFQNKQEICKYYLKEVENNLIKIYRENEIWLY